MEQHTKLKKKKLVLLKSSRDKETNIQNRGTGAG